MRRSTEILLLTLFLALGIRDRIFAADRIEANSHYFTVPVIKGLSANPIVRISIYVPSGKDSLVLESMAGTINTPAIPLIQQIDFYLTGAQPFSTDRPVASLHTFGASWKANTRVSLKPGLHFIWISIVLRPDASIDGKLDLRCHQLTENRGKTFLVKSDGSDPIRRLGVAVRKAGEDKVHTYRIPGITYTSEGSLIAVYDVRYQNSTDLPGNIDVGMSRSKDQGKTWEPMKVIMDMGPPQENNGVGDPAVLYDPVKKQIWVAALWSKGNRSIAGSLPGISPDSTGQLVLVRSTDDGETWSIPKSITPEVKNPIWHLFFDGPGSGIAMQDGKLVFAAQYWNESKIPFSTLIYSDDHGQTWKGQINGPKSNTTESQLVETTPGTILLNMRDNRGGFRSVATTRDLGKTWTEHRSSYQALPDPVCMASLIKSESLVHGKKTEVLYFSNPNTSSGRHHLTIKASLDLGEHWLPTHELLIDERSCFGYSSLTRIDDQTIGLLYEGVRDLYFVKIPVKEIQEK